MNASEPSDARSFVAATWAAPIGVLSGLTGLGGAEFRLPIIAGVLGYSTRSAVPIDLCVSLLTLVTSLIVRARSLSLTLVVPLLPVILAFIVGGSLASFAGPTIAARIALPALPLVRLAVGFAGGLTAGFVSSTVGVAGGEVQIALLVLVFGVDIKTAGTASLCVSLPTLAINVSRYAARGAVSPRALRSTIVPMSVASIVGAIEGGAFATAVPVRYLRVGLGVLPIVLSQVVFRRR